MKNLIGKISFILFVTIFTCTMNAYSGIHFGLSSAVREKVNKLTEMIERKNQPPIILYLIAKPTTVLQNESSTISCVAFDPDDDVLKYTWVFTDGTISGTEKKIIWSAPVTTGTYTITCKVEDGRGGEDQKSVDIEVTGNAIVKWIFSSKYFYFIVSSPAIGSDGTIYIGSSYHRLYAINPNGTKKWEFLSGGDIDSSPAIGSDGTIYVGSNDGKLYAINPNGTEKWEFLTSSPIVSSPAIGSDGTIYVSSYDGKLYAINPDGTKKWEFLRWEFLLAEGDIDSSPAIGFDGTIYVGSYDGKLYAINPDGTKKWEFLTGNFVVSSPAIGSNGTIYIGSCDGRLYAINPDGSMKWKFYVRGWILSSLTIASDGTLYVVGDIGKIYAINVSEALADTPWPMFHHDSKHTGKVF